MLFMPTLVRRLAWVVAGVLAAWLLWCVVGWAVLPSMLQRMAERQLSDKLGRVVAVGSVQFRPWSLELELHDLRIAGAGGNVGDDSTPQLELQRVYVDAELQSLWHLAPVLDAVQLQGLHLRLRHQGQGHYDVDDVLQRLLNQPPSDPVRYAVYNIALQDLQVDFDDVRPNGTVVHHSLRDGQLQLPFISNLPAKRSVQVKPQLVFTLNGAHWDSDAMALPFADDPQGNVHVQVDKLDLAPYLPYWPATLAQRPTQAVLKADVRLSFVDEDPQPHVLLQSLQLQADSIAWVDTQANNTRMALRDVRLEASQWRWPEVAGAAPASGALKGRAVLTMQGVAGQAALQWQLEGSPSKGQATAQLQQLPLAMANPYTQALWNPQQPLQLQGTLDATLHAQWNGTAGVTGQWLPNLQLSVPELTVRKLALQPANASASASASASADAQSPQQWPQLQQLRLQGVQLDLSQQRVQVQSLQVQQPRMALQRNAQGVLNVQAWLASSPASAAPKPSVPWVVQLDALTVRDGSVAWSDWQPATPVQLLMNGVQLQVQSLVWGQASAKPVVWSVQAGIAGTSKEAGKNASASGFVRLQGSAQLLAQGVPQRLSAQGQLQRVPVHLAMPYVADRLNVEVRRADASFSGQVDWVQAGNQVQVKGDAALEDLHATIANGSSQDGDDLLRWKALQVPGLQLQMGDGQAVRVSALEASLTDFYASILVRPDSTLNLEHLLKNSSASSTQAVADSPASRPTMVVNMGPLRLLRGKVDFEDQFIRPNYALHITQLNGRLSAFNSQASANGSPAMADLELQGRAEGTASLDVNGKFNPLVKPLVLDMSARLRDLELSPFSPYAVKYAGYGIERGKMSMDLHYTVQPDGQLTATNKLVLNQLRFGDQPLSAKTLPVKLAVALLADSHGVIDLDFPISGSINDPQFSLGPLLWKALGNLIVKAATSPFKWLAALGGTTESESNGALAFVAGSTKLSEAAQNTLRTLAPNLRNKPNLLLTIHGQANPAQDWLDSSAVDDDVLRDLAMQRAIAVKEFLLNQQVPVEQVFLGTVRTQSVTDNPVQAQVLLEVGIE
ncbi:DUF748 domain-containing protein [Curvibacter sp. CHRR-16]|uniref:DUF748 domain-containing protein n=1 Tax=Curvibacter sp. CHRR-16 TaxID=2835872 RepID=UPI001BD9D0FE|nr:DUF748 domain-containing protein [Curvibacter sp. CHRR-16]MBT0569480.1 DUF748 domain-containing protein [Curvibacter sp. CHRR-16]